MSGSELDLPPVEELTPAGPAVVTGLERQLAVAHWLLGAADDRGLAREQWEALDGVALLACGGTLGAVRAPARLVWAVLGTEDLAAVDAGLRRWFDGGAAFMDLHSLLYYFLVPGSTAKHWPREDFPDVECLGRDHFLGVPAVRLVEPRGRSYWCMPMDGPGDLCYVDEVQELLRRGQAVRGDVPCVE